MRNSTTQTNIEQGRRLLAAGCPYVKLHMQPVNHKIVPDPISLGRLWDLAGRHELHGAVEDLLVQARQMEIGITSSDLVETLVSALEEHFKKLNNTQTQNTR